MQNLTNLIFLWLNHPFSWQCQKSCHCWIMEWIWLEPEHPGNVCSRL